MNETWLDRIKEKKRALKMTNETLSERSGIPLGTLNKILAGTSDDPKMSTVSAFAEVFDISADYIIFGEDTSLRLSKTEKELIEKFRTLDGRAKDIVIMLTEKEAGRFDTAPSEAAKAEILVSDRFKFTAPEKKSENRFRLPIYDLPVSAGRGSLLDGSGSDFITLTSGGETLGADFALRISGNSMEPRYLDGDIILVHEQSSVGIGELGVFVCSDGVSSEGYFKRFGGDRLISLNPEYKDIYLDSFDSVLCRGKVIGRLPRKQ